MLKKQNQTRKMNEKNDQLEFLEGQEWGTI
jgi:hypothetical protein